MFVKEEARLHADDLREYIMPRGRLVGEQGRYSNKHVMQRLGYGSLPVDEFGGGAR